MIAAPLPPDEPARLEALRRTRLLDSAPDPAFDDFVKIAALICRTPIALVSLVDADRQWFKARIGVDLPETPRSESFCAHAILERRVLEVPDAKDDQRFVDNPLVTGDPRIRFYAGAPLVTSEGQALGTLCVIDREPRRLDAQQIEALQALARQVMIYIELRMREELLDRSTEELHKSQRESRTAARAVQSLLNLQRAIFEGASHAIIACAPDGTVLSFNKAAARMLGYDPAEVIGRLTPVHFHDPAELARRAREASAELGEPIERGLGALTARARKSLADEREWTFVRKDGSRFPVLLAMTALRDPQGTLTGFVGLAQDITERKQVEQLKNEFVAIVSHELRTPLTSIRGALGLLEAGVLGALGEEAKEMIAIARSNSDRLIRLINEILDLEKIEAGKIELSLSQIDAGELARAALEGISGYASEAQVELQSKVAERAALVGDRDRLLQVLTNLLSNAIKFSPPRGTVSLTVETSGANLRFAVKDSGPGIPEHQRMLLFRKFQQLDSSDTRRKGGTGLGLAITKAIVEQHRGRIWVESEAGKGATFLFEIPRRTPDRAPRQEQPRRVLVVEDDGDLQAAVLAALAGGGYNARAAASVEGARTLLQQGRPEAVLLDLGLPGGTALELYSELRASEATAELPVLVLGAALPIDVVENALEPEPLLRALRRLLRGANARRALVVGEERDAISALLASAGIDPAPVRDGESAPDVVVLSGASAPPNLPRAPILLCGTRDWSAEDRARMAAALASGSPRGASAEEVLGKLRAALGVPEPVRP